MFASRSEVIAQHGMVATSQPLATQVGLDAVSYTHLTLPTIYSV